MLTFGVSAYFIKILFENRFGEIELWVAAGVFFPILYIYLRFLKWFAQIEYGE